MIKTIAWIAYFLVCLVKTMFHYLPVRFYTLIKKYDRSDKHMFRLAHGWGRSTVQTTGSTVRVNGLENIPDHNRICFISNHQSLFDIPIILGFIPRPIGFIAKKELIRVPIMSFWMKRMYCIFLDRKDLRQSSRALHEGVENIKKGHPMLIFPEGTRSKGNTMNPFKPGSLKMAFRSEATLVPLTVSGSYKMLEANGWLLKGVPVTLTIHPAIETGNLSDLEKKNLHTTLWDIIHKPLEES